MSHLVTPEVKTAAYEIRDLMATYRKSEDRINIGAYKRGSNPRIDAAIDRADFDQQLPSAARRRTFPA